MVLSKFTKIFRVEKEVYAYYHSLRMKPVYLKESEHLNLQKFLKGKPYILDSITLEELRKYRIIVDDETIDAKDLDRVRESIDKPYISVAYFILTEQCNLACRYCFLGNGKKDKVQITNYPMSEQTAKAAIEYFAKQTKSIDQYFNERKEIVFYGGEPLINFGTLQFIIRECRSLQKKGEISKDINYSLITNGSLLTEEKIDFLKANNINVSISIDGVDECSNADRVNKKGKSVYQQIIKSLEIAKERGLNVGLSITLTEKTLESTEAIIQLAEQFDINSISFNIIYQTNNYAMSKKYYKKASDFIIEFYKISRNKGIYEDRIMRKVKSFVNSSFYFSDCAATSGNQVVITPDGKVGLCHGCMENRDFFISSITDLDCNLEENEALGRWQQFSPIFKDICLSCSCLGLCGGGCPVNAGITSESNFSQVIDENFCIHAKKTLEFMIEDLYHMALKEM